jgi:hypothetical protein
LTSKSTKLNLGLISLIPQAKTTLCLIGGRNLVAGDCMSHRPKLAKGSMTALKKAYQQAIYEVYSGQVTIQIKIGEACPTLDSLIAESDRFPSWALITAFNPYSQLLSELENQQRHHQLIEHLKQLQLPWLEAVGKDPQGIWTPEPSLLILGIERFEAIAIGQRFEQNAIVYGELNQSAELLWLYEDN